MAFIGIYVGSVFDFDRFNHTARLPLKHLHVTRSQTSLLNSGLYNEYVVRAHVHVVRLYIICIPRE